MVHGFSTLHKLSTWGLTSAVMRARHSAGAGHGMLGAACDATAEVEGVSS